MHRQRRQALGGPPRLFGARAEDGLGGPYSHFGVEPPGGDARAVGVDVHGEYAESLGVGRVALFGGVFVDYPGGFGEVHFGKLGRKARK